MTTKYVPAWMAGLILAVAICPGKCVAEETLPGGYQSAAVTGEWVGAAAAFAIKAEEKAMLKTKGRNAIHHGIQRACKGSGAKGFGTTDVEIGKGAPP